MKEIKTKPNGGRPRLLASAVKAPKTAMKDVWLKSREKAVSEIKEMPFASQQGESSNAPANNAADQMLSGTKGTMKRGADLTRRGGKKQAQSTSQKVREQRKIVHTAEEGSKSVTAAPNKIKTRLPCRQSHQGKTAKSRESGRPLRENDTAGGQGRAEVRKSSAKSGSDRCRVCPENSPVRSHHCKSDSEWNQNGG